MIIGVNSNPVRIPISRPDRGYYLRWYYNGWHYWFFLPGSETIKTEGQKYRTFGTKQISLSSGQVTLSQVGAIRTILNARDVFILTDYGWKSVRIESATVPVYNSQVDATEIELTAIIGSRDLSLTGFSPVVIIPVVIPPVLYNGWGALYNWYAVSNVHGIAPTGWHVPTFEEFDVLISFLGGYVGSGGKLKKTGIIDWSYPNTDATNSSGFTAIAGGYRGTDGVFYSKYLHAFFISTYIGDSRGLSLQHNSADASTFYGSNHSMGCSVRLVKDDSIDPGTVTDYDGNIYPTVKIGDQVWMAANFCCSHYSDGTPINHITGNDEWIDDTVGAMCFYGNDIMTLDHIDIISSQPQNDLFNPQPSFQATSTAEVTWEVFWTIRNAAHDVLSTGSETFTILAGTGTYTFTGLMTPDEVGSTFDFQIGKTSTMELTSNHFKIGL